MIVDRHKNPFVISFASLVAIWLEAVGYRSPPFTCILSYTSLQSLIDAVAPSVSPY